MNGSIQFTELEKTITNAIHGHIIKGEKVSIDLIAKECYVSKASIVKLAKKLGFSGYSEMYYILMSSSRTQRATDFSHIINLTSDESMKASILLFCDLLYEYHHAKIHLDSIGLCDAARDYYLQKLLMFGFDVVSSYHFTAFHKEKPGIFCFLSYSGTRQEIFDRVNAAIQNDFKVLALTGNKNSPLGTTADYTIEVSGERSIPANYQPNFFTANLIILLEMVLAEYSNRYLSDKQ